MLIVIKHKTATELLHTEFQEKQANTGPLLLKYLTQK